MMQQAIHRCFSNTDVSSIVIDPLANTTRAHKFYERLGFQFVERRHFGEDDCFVYEISKKNWIANEANNRTDVRG